MKRHSKKRWIRIIICAVFIVLITGGYFTYQNTKVKGAITIEAGERELLVSDFLNYNHLDAKFITDIHTINTTQCARYEIELMVEDEVFHSKLIVEDTTAPVGEAIPQTICIGERIAAMSFFRDIKDFSSVSASFVGEVDYDQLGEQTVHLLLKDMYDNETEYISTLFISCVKPSVIIEAGSDPVSLDDFFVESGMQGSFLTDISTIDYKKVGTTKIQIQSGNLTYPSKLEIVDRVKPTAVVKEQTIWVNESIAPEAFVENIEDETNVTVTYKRQPDFKEIGQQSIAIILTDEGKNVTEYYTSLFVLEDKEAPVIHGVADIHLEIGDKISYKKGVTVTDNKDETVSLQIDSSNVKLNQSGEYRVIYSATDEAGNTATEEITVYVRKKNVTTEEINALADQLIKKLGIRNQSFYQQTKAIYDWGHKNILYVGTSDKSSWQNAAYEGIVKKVGDCYTYYAYAHVMFSRLGIEDMKVTRVGESRTHHYWNLVKTEKGWYHFDCGKRKYYFNGYMATDADLLAYTKKLESERGIKNYFTFDPTGLPNRAEQPYR